MNGHSRRFYHEGFVGLTRPPAVFCTEAGASLKTNFMLSCRTRDEAGFTLLELLIAITIVALIMGILYGGLDMGNRVWQAGELRMERNQRLRLVLNQLAEEVRSAYFVSMKGETVDDKYLAFWGEPERIRFVTVTAGLLSEPLENRLRAVSYYVDGDDGLVFKETALNYDDFFSQLETQEPVTLDSEVAEIGFRYYYVPEEEGDEGIEAEGIWSSEWDPTDKDPTKDPTNDPITTELPNAVEITLTMKPEGEGKEAKTIAPLIVPIFWGQGLRSENEVS